MPPYGSHGGPQHGRPWMPAHPPAMAPPMPPPVRPRADGRAVGALVLGILSVVCLGVGFLAGIPAIVIGAMSRREIDRSHGALTGRGLAAAGIATGLFGTGLSLVFVLVVAAGVLEAMKSDDQTAEAPRNVPVASGTRSYGSLDVIDLDEKKPLRVQLRDIARTSGGRGRTVVLQTYVRSSRECADVAASLVDPRMQRALANVTLVRANIEIFESELRDMRLDTDSAPWFYKLDVNARPTDAVSADEWDANVPENMAPILADFVRGGLGARRAPSPVGTAL